MVPRARVELATFGLGISRSIHLSYGGSFYYRLIIPTILSFQYPSTPELIHKLFELLLYYKVLQYNIRKVSEVPLLVCHNTLSLE